jgi:hypothetical protein
MSLSATIGLLACGAGGIRIMPSAVSIAGNPAMDAARTALLVRLSSVNALWILTRISILETPTAG